MTVYVDNMRARYQRMVMCHMAADTREELFDMCDKIGLDTRWLQYPGTWREHMDVSLSKRALAVRNGAVEVTRQELVRWMIDTRRGV